MPHQTRCDVHNQGAMPSRNLPSNISLEVLDEIRDVILCLDPDGNILYANQTASEKLGYSSNQLAMMAIHDLCPDFSLPRLISSIVPDSALPSDRLYAYFQTREDLWPIPFEIRVKTQRDRGRVFHFFFARETIPQERSVAAMDNMEEKDGPSFPGEDFGLAISSPEGRLLEVSEYFCRILGYDEKELIGKHFKEFTHPHDLDPSQRSKQKILDRQATVLWQEKRYIRKDGKIIWAALSTSVQWDSQGRPVRLVSHIQEITERKKREKALNETMQLFQYAFKDAAVGMIILDSAGYFLKVNPYLCQLLGYTEDELKGKHYVDITHPEDVKLSVEFDLRLLNREMTSNFYEKRYLHQNGNPIWVLISNSLVYDEKDRPRYFLAHCQDIRQRKEAEQRLQESESRFQLFMKHLPGKAFIKDGGKQYLYANAFLNSLVEDRLGRGALGLRDREIFDGEYASQMEENDKMVLTHGEAMEFVEHSNNKGEEKHWLTYKFPIDRDEDSTLLGGIGLDITTRIYAQRELEKRDQELELQKDNLERVNNALKVLMDYRQQEMLQKEKDTLAAIEKLVLPYLEVLATRGLPPDAAQYLNIGLDNLKNISGDFVGRLSSTETLLSPTEFQVADLLRHGKTSDEIADILCISPYTVARHRAGIRKKLGLTNKKVNLRSHLKSLT